MITVYYGSYSTEKGMSEHCYDPEPVLNTLFENLELTPNNILRRCPAFTGFFKNIFKIKSSYDYNILWDGNAFTSSMYDQNFFNNTIIARDPSIGILSYLNPGMFFFADCEKLELEVTYPLYEKDIPYDGVIIPGKYDCANHFRKNECAIKLKKPQIVDIHDGDTLYYVRFHTEKKIKFVKFIVTPEILSLTSFIFDHSIHTTKIIPLEWYYTIMKKHYNKKLIKLIKNNILE